MPAGKTTANPRKSPRQQRSRATVEAILDAAAHILTRGGPAALNTNLVAETAGVSVGSLYQYFPNKEAVLTALHCRHADGMRNLIAAEVDRPRRRLADAVSSLVGAVVRAHLLEPELHRALEGIRPVSNGQDREDAVREDIRSQVQVLLKRYRSELSVTNLPLATYMVVTTVEALVHAAMIDPPKNFSASQLEHAIIDLILRYLAGRPAEE